MRTATRAKPQEPPKQRHQRAIRPPGVKGGVSPGNPPIYDPVRFPHITKTLCAQYGFTNKQLAPVFGVSIHTINDWMKLHPELREAAWAGKDEFDGERVENALLKRALGYEYTEVTKTRIHLKGKDAEGKDIRVPAERISTVVKELPPDPKSAMFWLVNRRRERWKLESTVNAKVDGKIEHNHSGTVVTAQLENLDSKQLLALKEMILLQQKNEQTPLQIGHDAIASDVDMSAIMQVAEKLQQEIYEEAEYTDV
jgi:hypothetical protein